MSSLSVYVSLLLKSKRLQQQQPQQAARAA